MRTNAANENLAGELHPSARSNGARRSRLRLGSRPVSALYGLAAFVTAALVLLPVSPRFSEQPHRDAGVFLYIGRRILDGDVPYTAVWDHKAPGIYYLDALALLLPGSDAWGIWVLSLATLAAALFIGFRYIAKAFGVVPAATISAIWPLALMGEDQTNLTEFFALPLQFAVVAVWVRMGPGLRKDDLRSAVALGVLASGLVLLRPNLVGMALAMAVLIAWEHRARRDWAELVQIASVVGLGATLPLLGVAAYFAANGALGELWDQVVVYNLAQASATPSDRILALGESVELLGPTRLLPLALLMWVAMAIRLRALRHLEPIARRTLMLGAVALPIEVALSSISARGFTHYYLPWLVPLSVLAAGVVALLWDACRHWSSPRRATLGALLAIAVGVLVVRAAVDAPERPWDIREPTRDAAVTYLREATSASDDVLIWGAETGVLWAADRQSPTRFVYQYALVAEGYTSEGMIEEFLADVEAGSPRLVIDASSATSWPLAVIDGPSQVGDSRLTEQFRRWVREHYTQTTTIEPAGWPVYERLVAP